MRIDALKSCLDSAGIYPYMISDMKNVAYLTGFEGSYARLFVTQSDLILLTDSRYSEYAESVLRKGRIVVQKGPFYESLNSLAAAEGWKQLHVEDSLVLSEFLSLQKKSAFIQLLPAEDFTQRLRLVKDASEIAIIKKAVALADECIAGIPALLKEGVREADISAEIEYFFRTHSSTGSSFDTIVAFGAHSSMPHHNTGSAKLVRGDAVLIDTGCVVEGYCSDITRTIFFGDPDDELIKIYGIVNEARGAAIAKITPGICAGILDRTARDIITEKGYGEAFGHSLGHGVGRDVHEPPRVKDTSEETLLPGCVITVEPGIYIPGKGGVRIEDMVLIGRSGAEILTSSSRDLVIL